MDSTTQQEPITIAIFGAGGDLTWRKLIPALFNLWLDKWLPEKFFILGLDRVPLDDVQWRDKMRTGVEQFSRQKLTDAAQWQAFAQHLGYQVADFLNDASYARLGERIAGQEQGWQAQPHRLFYLAISPVLFEPVAKHLGSANLLPDPVRHRMVVEKPFGRDLASAQELNRTLTGLFEERQLYRIDHYLGKETVQNILALRFANSIFEPVWNRRYIDHIQITVAEEVGVEHRGGYYDQSGAMRDMIQNHLFRVLTLLAMEPPVSFDDNEVRNKKVDVLKAMRPLAPEQIDQVAVRGQYDAGKVGARALPAYRSEEGVNPKSNTETFAALKVFIDNWRWQDVPFYLRTGKALMDRVAEVVVQFKPVPHRSFPTNVATNWPPNRLVLQIQPTEGILICMQAKLPGVRMRLQPINLHVSYEEAFNTPSPEGYETLLLDAMLGDATLFMRADQVEVAWAIVAPVLERWAAVAPTDFPNYPAGSWGPEAADELLLRDGRQWLDPRELVKTPALRKESRP